MKINSLRNFLVLGIMLFSVSALYSQSTVYLSDEREQAPMTHYSFKDYEDGSRVGYFNLMGSFSLKDLHRIEQHFINNKSVVRISIMEKNAASLEHRVFIKTNGKFATKEWLLEELENLFANGKYGQL